MSTSMIGTGLRAARLRLGLSLRSVAEALGVSASLISQVETGKTQPSVATLYALVNFLGISIDELLEIARPAAAEPSRAHAPNPVPAFKRAEQNPVIEMQNGVRWERLAVRPGSEVDPLMVTYAPGASSSIEGRPMHHVGVEWVLVLEGELTLQLDLDAYLLSPGDSMQFDSAQPHMYTNRGDVAAKGVWFVLGRKVHSAPAVPTCPPDDEAYAGMVGVTEELQTMDNLGPWATGRN